MPIRHWIHCLGPVSFAATIALLVCASCRGSDTPSCVDFGGAADASRDPAFGPADAAPLPADAASPASGDAASDGAPDPSAWGCYDDSDCAVFSTRPNCEGNRCVASAEVIACDDGLKLATPNVAVRHTFVGTNGSVTDTCNARGDLVAYGCARRMQCTVPPNADCWPVGTGLVSSETTIVDCAAGCHDGRCDGRCPQQGDAVSFGPAQTDGSQLVHDDSNGRTYACERAHSSSCPATLTGATGHVDARSVADNLCTGAHFGSIDVVLDSDASARCAFQCSVARTCEAP